MKRTMFSALQIQRLASLHPACYETVAVGSGTAGQVIKAMQPGHSVLVPPSDLPSLAKAAYYQRCGYVTSREQGLIRFFLRAKPAPSSRHAQDGSPALL